MMGNNSFGIYAPLTAELLGYATGAHHGQFDCVDINHKSGFQHRLENKEKKEIYYEETLANFLKTFEEPQLDDLFGKSVKEIETFYKRILLLLKTSKSKQEDLQFYISLLERLLLSSVVDGDCRDSAEFMENRKFPPPRTKEERILLWERLSARVDRQLDELPADTPIQKARQTISKQCREAASQPGGIYRLNVPTGGGKTLSSLRFALAHAAKFGKSRIIFTAPLLTILEQTVKEVRKYIQEDSLILEHHSNVVQEQEKHVVQEQEKSDAQEQEKSDAQDVTKLLMETWESPIILTTMVQLFNTMFDGRNSCIRRFHALCNSVLIIDEVQSVPNHLLSLFHLAISFLAETCGTTIVLCSATQPCSEAANHPIAVPTKEMVPYQPEIWQVFQRTRIISVEDGKGMELEEIPTFAEQVLKDAESLLVICNTKREAETIYRALPAERYLKFHLSASMCPKHRKEVLEQLKCVLLPPDADDAIQVKAHRKIVCVSTQVMEAGVDISFAWVIRLTAGMDSIVQSAGRCNRNGESKTLAPVYMVHCSNENLRHLQEIEQAKYATLAMLKDVQQHPEDFDSSVTSDKAIQCYYKHYYRQLLNYMGVHFQDGLVNADGVKTTLYSLLSNNEAFVDLSQNPSIEKFSLLQAFRTAGRCFSVFDENTVDVLVPYGKGKELISELEAICLPYDLSKMKALLKEAKDYTISLYEGQFKQLADNHALVSLCKGEILAVREGYYHEEVGLQMQMEQGNQELLEV